jgi:hypothetical protein
MEDVGIIYGHLVYFAAISYLMWILWSFHIFFPRFGILYREKSGNPELDWKPSVRADLWLEPKRN